MALSYSAGKKESCGSIYMARCTITGDGSTVVAATTGTAYAASLWGFKEIVAMSALSAPIATIQVGNTLSNEGASVTLTASATYTPGNGVVVSFIIFGK